MGRLTWTTEWLRPVLKVIEKNEKILRWTFHVWWCWFSRNGSRRHASAVVVTRSYYYLIWSGDQDQDQDHLSAQTFGLFHISKPPKSNLALCEKSYIVVTMKRMKDISFKRYRSSFTCLQPDPASAYLFGNDSLGWTLSHQRGQTSGVGFRPRTNAFKRALESRLPRLEMTTNSQWQ